MDLCRCSYVIMGILQTANATNKVRGLTINEIQSFEQVSKTNTLYLKIKTMEKLGFLQEGVKAGRAKTYFLTEKGISELPTKNINKGESKHEE